ncbi:MAG: hypothetical protein J6J36_00770 [Clostridia bacterium]|nr:hypothetical protein [Clostridia bacterium]
MRVGYIFNRKNEVYICPKCWKMVYAKQIGKIKKFFLEKIWRKVNLYDEEQVRLYWTKFGPTVVADTTGKAIARIELGLEDLDKTLEKMKDEEKFSTTL